MAPRDSPKAVQKVKSAVRATGTKARVASGLRPQGSPVSIKKTMVARKPTESQVKAPLKVANTTETRPRTSTVPKISTPKPKENKPSLPGSVTKSTKKSSWKRRPKPAHSGVPVPEKMKKLLQKQLMDSDCSL